jgi:hypothetical protein
MLKPSTKQAKKVLTEKPLRTTQQTGKQPRRSQPRLATIKMIEAHIRAHDGEHRKRALWESLPKQMMYPTYCAALEYLSESRKISIDREGKVGWIFYPQATRRLLKQSVPWTARATARAGK